MKNKFPEHLPKAYKGSKLTVKAMYDAFRQVRVVREASKVETSRKSKVPA